MAKTTFSGPVICETSSQTQGPIKFHTTASGAATSDIATAVMQQECTVVGTTSGASGMRLPANSEVQNFNLMVRANTSADAVAVRIGNSADVDYFGQINASGVGLYDIGDYAVSAASFFNVGTTAMNVFVDVTALSSGLPAGFDAILRMTFKPR